MHRGVRFRGLHRLLVKFNMESVCVCGASLFDSLCRGGFD